MEALGVTRGGQKEGPAQGNSPENSCSQSRHGLKFPDKKPFPHCSPFGSTIHHKSMLHTHSHTHTVLYAHPHAGQRAPGLRRSLPSAQGLPQSAGTVAGRGERHWVPSTQSQLPVKSWWTRTAPLLPPFLIMTGPRGPKQRGRLSEDGKWERRAGEGEGREAGGTDICSGEKQAHGQTQSGHRAPSLTLREVSLPGSHRHACRGAPAVE